MMPFPLSAAYLCANCEFVGICSWRCEKCAGGSLVSLRKLLDRAAPTAADAEVEKLIQSVPRKRVKR